MKKNFVRFLSPGTIVAEETVKPIDSWDIPTAVKMSRDIKERYGALPYSFQFLIKEREDDELDSKVTERSCLYYLGGTVLTLEEVKEKMPEERILISNMECNHYDRIVINENS
jgi:hypothetical protein